MTNILFLLFTYVTEAFIVYLYIRTIYKAKKNKFLSLSLCIIFYIFVMLIYRYITTNEIVNSIIILIVDILLIKIAFESSTKSAIFHGTVLCILLYISEFVTMYTIAIIFNISSHASINEHFEIGSILSHLLYFTCCMILSRFSAKEDHSKSWGRWFLLSLLPVSSIFVILVIRGLTNNNISSHQNFICILSIALLLVVNFVIYIIYEKAEKSSQKLIELELVNQKNDINMQYLELLEKKNETMNIMVHDYKNHLMDIGAMSDSSEIKEYIDSMMGEITKYNRIAKTKNKMLDVILNKYTDICDNKGICFKTEIMTDNLDFIDNYDISSLFNNILDNAVEAASKSEKKYIHLEITCSQNSYHKIIAVNSCDTEPHSEKGKLITTKKNKDTHGFGTKSIRKIVKKYSGETHWEYDNELKQFKLIIFFPNE